MADDEALTITEAADRAGVARSTIRRALDRDAFPNATQDPDDPRGTWLIPVSDLVDAGYPPQDDATDAPQVDETGATGGAVGDATERAPGTALISVEALSPLFQQIANAEARATRAELVLEARERELAEARAQAEHDRSSRDVPPPWRIGVDIALGALGVSVAVSVGLTGDEPFAIALATVGVIMLLFGVVGAWRLSRSHRER